MEAVDRLEYLGIVELDLAETDQTVGMPFDEILGTVEILRFGQQKCEAIDLIQFRQQLLQERRIAVIVHVRVNEPWLGKRRRQQDYENCQQKNIARSHHWDILQHNTVPARG